MHLLLTEQESVNCEAEAAAAAARQTSAVRCDSCGSWSAECEQRHEEDTVAVAETALMHWCIDCSQRLCSNCVVIHASLQTGTGSSHCVIPLPVRDRQFHGLPCPSHVDRSSDLFCLHCRQLVCAACAASPEHRDHSCDDVALSAARLRTQLVNDVAVVDQRRRRCDELVADVSADKHDWLSSVQTADNELRAAADRLRTLLDRHCASLSDELVAVKQSRLKEFQTRLEDVQHERSRLDSVRQNLHATVDAASDVQLLMQAGDLHESVERRLAESSPTAVTSRRARQTVVFVPSVTAQRLGRDDAGCLLGRVEVVGGGATETVTQTEGARVKRASAAAAGRQRQESSQLTSTLYYRQLLATLSDGELPVCGLAVVADRLYVCRSQSPHVDVYDAARTTYRRLQWSIHVPAMSGPSDMVGSCADVVGTLFISAETDGGVFRVTLRSGDVVQHTRWATDDRPYGVSLMTNESRHLLVLSRQAASVSVLDGDDGRPLRRLRLPASVASPWSAVYMPAVWEAPVPGDLVVCHGDLMSARRGVSRLDWSTGSVTQRYQWLSEERGGRASVMHVVPESADGCACALLVADQCSNSVQRVEVSLDSHESLLADARLHSDVEQPRRLCVDSTRQRLVVGLDDGRVKVFANGCVVM